MKEAQALLMYRYVQNTTSVQKLSVTRYILAPGAVFASQYREQPISLNMHFPSPQQSTRATPGRSACGWEGFVAEDTFSE